MCRRRNGSCRMPNWLRDYEARTCSILAAISFSCAVTSFAVFTDSAVLSLTMPLKPAVCTVVSSEELYGLTKCHWTSCRGSCTASFFNCTQIKVIYFLLENQTSIIADPDLYETRHNVLSNRSNMRHDNHKSSFNTHEDRDNLPLAEFDEPTVELSTAMPNVSRNATYKEDLVHQVIIKSIPQNNSLFLNRLININKTNFTNTSENDTVLNIITKNLNVLPIDKSVSSTDFISAQFISEYAKDNEEEEHLHLNSSDFMISVIPLYVNIFGCGYEPEELCEHFLANYTHVGLEFQCLVSFENKVFAIPDPVDYDFTKFKDPMRSLLLSLIPSGICVLSASYIKVRQLYRMKPYDVEDEPPKRKRPLFKKISPNTKNNKILTNSEKSSTKLLLNKKEQEQPAFIQVQISPPSRPVTEQTHHFDQEQFL